MKQINIADYSEEIWREIPNTNGFYQVSNFGRAKVARRHVLRNNHNGSFWTKEKILKQNPVGRGYLSFMTHLNGKSVRVLTHILVATFWCLNEENKPQVNHRNGIKSDNHYSNLEWCTAQENINHAFDTGLNIKVKQNDKHRSKPVIQIDKSGIEICEFPSLKQVERSTGFKHPNIHYAIKNKIISNGYFWKYKN